MGDQVNDSIAGRLLLEAFVEDIWCAFTGEGKFDMSVNVEADAKDRKVIYVTLTGPPSAPWGAFLGPKCSNMELLMQLLRRQQHLKHNRYLNVSLVKVDGDNHTFQEFVDTNVFKKQ
jgi:hypothetical protein